MDKTEIEKKLNQELIEKKELISELNAANDKLLSILSHDFKNPFNILLGFCNILSKDYDKLNSVKIKEFINILSTTTKNAYSLLETLIMWANTQRGKISFEPSKLDLLHTVNSVITLFSSQSLQKNITLINKIEEGIFVFADDNMLNTIIRNLISNAIKFSNKNSQILISANIENPFCVVSVKDFGVGMNEETKEKLFKIDSNFRSVGTSKETGHGLGLILCKELVKKNGGQIYVESEEGKGSEFKFTIPLFKEEEQNV